MQVVLFVVKDVRMDIEDNYRGVHSVALPAMLSSVLCKFLYTLYWDACFGEPLNQPDPSKPNLDYGRLLETYLNLTCRCIGY